MKTQDTQIKIVLTDRAPVRVTPAVWPELASAKGDSWGTNGDYARHSQASAQGELDEYRLVVRRHMGTGRVLVYARLDAASAWTGTEDRAEGELLEEEDDVAAAIRRVGQRCELPDCIIRDCIADLPSEDLDDGGPVQASCSL